MKIKKGDHVIVLKGKDRGRDGVVMRVLPKEGKVIVEGVNMVKKHQKAQPGTRPSARPTRHHCAPWTRPTRGS